LSSREDERERITRARRAAEALFKTRRQVTKQLVSDALPSVDERAHKPRVLKALSPAPIRHEGREAPVESKERISFEIPTSHFARIRAWVKYGMTAAQVAVNHGEVL
jgi:hypothetical protein